MRVSSTPSASTRARRWKQHLRNKPYDGEKIADPAQACPVVKDTPKELSTPKLGRFFEMITKNQINFFRKKNVTVNLLKDFCIFSNPELVLKKCSQNYKRFTRPELRSVTFDHSAINKYSLGAEVLLALSTREGERYRSMNSYPKASLRGHNPKNAEHLDIINDVGIVAEIDAVNSRKSKHDEKLVHVFKSECLTSESPSGAAHDQKNNTANEVLVHLRRCLNDHNLALKQTAADRFRNCIAEVLDNAGEHCYLTHPAWFVRSYLNNNGLNKFFELTIFNFGCSYAETFTRLDDGSYAKKTAKRYVDKHSDKFNEDALYTVAALQGRISSKNMHDFDNRGQGTIVLIESFEKMYNEYRALKLDSSEQFSSIMNIITGKTVITFDGTYSSKKIVSNETERVIYPFNDEQDLQKAPSNRCVKIMKDAFFPGAIINIRLPLSASIESSI
ncbi:hypothetical protein [Aeromonas veronii]|uniref:hypothetical protein n=1 Tax=Aeromonas veronii TaxID=654 RepID=UPI000B2EB9E4|nr:hypothetical protein [Aeromonas veronii]